MRVRFWGTRGSIATPGKSTVYFGGNTSCTEIITDAGYHLILDCGTGARLLGNQMMAKASGPLTGSILLTHTHWDHIQGFPFFAPLFVPGNHFEVYGPEGCHTSLRDVLSGQMDYHYFPVELNQLAAQINYQDLSEGAHQIGGVTVRAQSMNHPSPTLGYRVEGDGVSVLYLCDHEMYSEKIWRDGAEPGRLDSILHDGDREHAEYMKDADVVVHEAQYTPEEYPAKRNWGHSTFEYVVSLAALAGVRRLYLTHHDPSHDDAFVTGIENRARQFAKEIGSNIEIACAYEGCEITV